MHTNLKYTRTDDIYCIIEHRVHICVNLLIYQTYNTALHKSRRLDGDPLGPRHLYEYINAWNFSIIWNDFTTTMIWPGDPCSSCPWRIFDNDPFPASCSVAVPTDSPPKMSWIWSPDTSFPVVVFWAFLLDEYFGGRNETLFRSTAFELKQSI